MKFLIHDHKAVHTDKVKVTSGDIRAQSMNYIFTKAFHSNTKKGSSLSKKVPSVLASSLNPPRVNDNGKEMNLQWYLFNGLADLLKTLKKHDL